MENTEYCDPEDPWGDHLSHTVQSKWRFPKSELEKKILYAVGRKYYQNHDERFFVIRISKDASLIQGKIKPRVPLQWVDACCEWAISARLKGKPISLKGLISLINNQVALEKFLEKYSRQNNVVLYDADSSNDDLDEAMENARKKYDGS